MKVPIIHILVNRRELRKTFSRELVLQPNEIVITPINAVFLQKVTQFVGEHMFDTDFSVELFIRQMGMSSSRIHWNQKALTAKSTGEFIRPIRLASTIPRGKTTRSVSSSRGICLSNRSLHNLMRWGL